MTLKDADISCRDFDSNQLAMESAPLQFDEPVKRHQDSPKTKLQGMQQEVPRDATGKLFIKLALLRHRHTPSQEWFSLKAWALP